VLRVYRTFIFFEDHTGMSEWKNRLKAAAVHLGISLLVAGCAAVLVFGVWYPYPYREISGGRELFLLVVGVDVVLGPLFTFIVFSRAKPRTELVRDLALVGLIQLAGLGYGLWTVHQARPVHLVFELDRFRAVHAVDVPEELLSRTPAGVDPLPLTGPTLLAVRPFASAQEGTDATLAALQGVSLASRPDLWQPYAQAVPRVLAAGRPVEQLKRRFPGHAAEIDQLIAATGRPEGALVILPLAARKSFWTVVLDARTAQVLGYLPLDSF
jgi:hypothetical protein